MATTLPHSPTSLLWSCEQIMALVDQDKLLRIQRVIPVINGRIPAAGAGSRRRDRPLKSLIYLEDFFSGQLFHQATWALDEKKFTLATIMRFLETGNLHLLIRDGIAAPSVDLSLLTKLSLVLTLLWRTMHPADQRSQKVLQGLTKGEWPNIGSINFPLADWAAAVLAGNFRFPTLIDDKGNLIGTSCFFNEKIEAYRVAVVKSGIPKLKNDRTGFISKTLPLSIFTLIEFLEVSPLIVQENVAVLDMFAPEIPAGWFIEEFHDALLKYASSLLLKPLAQSVEGLKTVSSLYAYWIRRVPIGDQLLGKYGPQILKVFATLNRQLLAKGPSPLSLDLSVTFYSIMLTKSPENYGATYPLLAELLKSEAFNEQLLLGDSFALFTPLSYYLSTQLDEAKIVELLDVLLCSPRFPVSFQRGRQLYTLFQLGLTSTRQILRANKESHLKDKDLEKLGHWYKAAVQYCSGLFSEPVDAPTLYHLLWACGGLIEDLDDTELPSSRFPKGVQKQIRDLAKKSGELIGNLFHMSPTEDLRDGLAFLCARHMLSCQWHLRKEWNPDEASEILLSGLLEGQTCLRSSLFPQLIACQNEMQALQLLEHHFAKSSLITEAPRLSLAISANLERSRDPHHFLRITKYLHSASQEFNEAWQAYLAAPNSTRSPSLSPKIDTFLKSLLLSTLVVIKSCIHKSLPQSPNTVLSQLQKDVSQALFDTLSLLHFAALKFGPYGPTGYSMFLQNFFTNFAAWNKTGKAVTLEVFQAVIKEQTSDLSRAKYFLLFLESFSKELAKADLDEVLFPELTRIFQAEKKELYPAAQSLLSALFLAHNKHAENYAPWYVQWMMATTASDFDIIRAGFPSLIKGLCGFNDPLAIYCVRLVIQEIDRLCDPPKEGPSTPASQTPPLHSGRPNPALLLGENSPFHHMMHAGQYLQVLIETIKAANLVVLEVVLPAVSRCFLERSGFIPSSQPLQLLLQEVAANNDYTTRGEVLSWYLDLLQELVTQGIVTSDLVLEHKKPKRRSPPEDELLQPAQAHQSLQRPPESAPAQKLRSKL